MFRVCSNWSLQQLEFAAKPSIDTTLGYTMVVFEMDCMMVVNDARSNNSNNLEDGLFSDNGQV
jgi:hypothetical protein